MSKSIFNNFSVLNFFFFFITGNKWENFLQYICDLRTIDTKGLIEPTRWQFSCYWKEFFTLWIEVSAWRFFPFTFSQLCIDKRAFSIVFSLSPRACFFSAFGWKNMNCMFTGEKVTALRLLCKHRLYQCKRSCWCCNIVCWCVAETRKGW